MGKGAKREKNTLILPRGPQLGLSSADNYSLGPGNMKRNHPGSIGTTPACQQCPKAVGSGGDGL